MCIETGRSGFIVGGTDPSEKRTEDKLLKATKDSCKTTIEIIHGLMAQMIKDKLFNSINPSKTPAVENTKWILSDLLLCNACWIK